MDRIYHGCANANADGTNKIITKGSDCLVRTNKYFWKDPTDVVTHIKTRSMTKKEPCISRRAFNKYFKEKGCSLDFLQLFLHQPGAFLRKRTYLQLLLLYFFKQIYIFTMLFTVFFLAYKK